MDDGDDRSVRLGRDVGESGGIVVAVAEEEENGTEIRLFSGVDDMVSPSQQLIHMHGVGASGRIVAKDRKVGGHLAVEQGHLLQFGARKLPEPACVGLCQQRSQPVPVGPPLRNPLVGEDLRHGRG